MFMLHLGGFRHCAVHALLSYLYNLRNPRFASDEEYILKDKPYSRLMAVFLLSARLFRLSWL